MIYDDVNIESAKAAKSRDRKFLASKIEKLILFAPITDYSIYLSSNMPSSNPAEEFGNKYYDSLQELTFNSRPIIESRTLIAQDNSIYASEIVSAIEKRIEKAIPNQKLFSIYLLDSISKNVGLPYTALFSKSLLKTFTRTYSLVDDPTRIKLIKLFKTWKVPTSLTGLPLFDSRQLDQIEQFLIKATAGNTVNSNSNNSSNSPSTGGNTLNTPPTPLGGMNGFGGNGGNFYNNLSYNEDPRLSLIRDIEDLTNMVNLRLIGVSSNDEKTVQRFNLLNQLKSILVNDSKLPIEQLKGVKQQLQTIRNDEMMKLNLLKQQQEQQHLQQHQEPQLLPPAKNQPLANPNNYNTANVETLFVMIESSFRSDKSPTEVPESMDQSNSFRGKLGLNNMSFLQNILNKTQGGPTPVSSGGSTIDFGFIQPKKEQLVSQFSLDGSFITQHTPSVFEIFLLYPEKETTMCSNCPKRFAATPEGHMAKQAHLDWHFRLSRRLAQNNLVNRSWYTSADDWASPESAKHVLTGSSEMENLDAVSRDDFAAAEHNVPIPAGSATSTVCDVCRENLEGVFDENSGEWVWRGAVSFRGGVRHFLCHLETQKRDRSPQRD